MRCLMVAVSVCLSLGLAACRSADAGAGGAEVAAAALFLASPEAGYITGQVLRIDGGASAAGPYTLEVFKRASTV